MEPACVPCCTGRIKVAQTGTGVNGKEGVCPAPRAGKATGEAHARRDHVPERPVGTAPANGAPEPAPDVYLNLADAVVIKRENLFLLASRDGRVPAGEEHPLGLWYRDCRYLRTHELRLDGTSPLPLQASDAQGTRAVHELTASGSISIRIERTLDDAVHLLERIVLRSHRDDDVELDLSLRLAVD